MNYRMTSKAEVDADIAAYVRNQELTEQFSGRVYPRISEHDAEALRLLYADKLPMSDAELSRLRGTYPGAQPQRKTQSMSESIRRNELSEIYGGSQDEQQPSFLDDGLQPGNWKKLADRRVPWPQDVNPLDALRQMSGFLAYRMLGDQAATMGRRVTDLVGLDQEI